MLGYNPIEKQQVAALPAWHCDCILSGWGELNMAYVIIDTCTKDEHCIETCPVNCIHPTKDEADFTTAPQLYVNPADCIDCGACIPVCPTGSIFVLEDLPAEHQGAVASNAAYFN